MEKICIKLLHLLDLSISLSVSIPIQQIYAFAHTCRQRKCNANLELQIYHIFAPFANIIKSVVLRWNDTPFATLWDQMKRE